MRADRAIVPPTHVTGVEPFLEWRPGTNEFHFVRTKDGSEHLMATGASRPFGSAPSAYIFDRTGRLIDWSRDIGDDPDFDERWNAQLSLSAAPVVSGADVVKWIDAGR